MPINTSKQQLNALFKRIQENLEEAVFDQLSDDEKGEKSSRGLYEELLNAPLQTIKARTLKERLCGEGVIVVGDYHPLSETKSVLLSILERMEEKPLLALSCLRAWRGGAKVPHDPIALLKERANDWPFRKEDWLPLLKYAQKQSIQVSGLRGRGEKGLSEEERYERWSTRLKRISKKHEGPILAIVGEINCAPGNFPRVLHRKCLAHQTESLLLGPAKLYWRLLEKGLEPCETLCVLGDKTLAIIPSHPLRRVNSYLAWQHDEPELFIPPAPLWCPENAANTYLQDLTNKLCSFFGADPELLAKAKTYLPRHAKELSQLLRELPQAEGETLLQQIENNESYCSPRGDYVYLARATLSHIGEELTHWLHLHFSPEANQDSDEEHYFHHVIRETIGFLGSKIFHGKRACPTLDSLYWLAGDLFSPSALAAQLALTQMEKEDAGDFSGPAELENAEVFSGLVHTMGYMLGESLWQKLQRGELPKEFPQQLIRSPLRNCKDLYIDLLGQ